MYANLYHHPSQLAAAAGAKEVVPRLFEAYAADPRLMGRIGDRACPKATVRRCVISVTISPG